MRMLTSWPVVGRFANRFCRSVLVLELLLAWKMLRHHSLEGKEPGDTYARFSFVISGAQCMERPTAPFTKVVGNSQPVSLCSRTMITEYQKREAGWRWSCSINTSLDFYN